MMISHATTSTLAEIDTEVTMTIARRRRTRSTIQTYRVPRLATTSQTIPRAHATVFAGNGPIEGTGT